MSNYLPVLGLAVCMGIAALPAIFNLRGDPHDERVYKYSRGFRIFLWIGSLCILVSGIVFKVLRLHGAPSAIQLALLVTIGALAVVGCVYTDKYHISINDEGVEFGAFASTFIRYEDVTALRKIFGRTPILEIHTREKTYSLSRNVQGSARLCELLAKKCALEFK
jgi:hypothetical protein